MPTLVLHVSKPSKARTVAVNGTLAWPAKDPRDVLDYQFDLGPALVGNEGDPISSIDVDIEPSQAGDLAVNNVMADGQVAVLWLAGGQAGTTYNVTVSVETMGGRTVQRTITLWVTQLSALSPAVPVTAPASPTPPAT